MALDLNLLKSSKTHTIEVLGEPLAFSLRRPGTRAILGVTPSVAAVEAKGRRFMRDRAEFANGLTDTVPGYRVAWSDLEVLIDFICAHVVKVDGLEDGGAPVVWADFPEQSRIDLFELMGLDLIMSMVTAVMSSAKMDPDTKKKSVNTSALLAASVPGVKEEE